MLTLIIVEKFASHKRPCVASCDCGEMPYPEVYPIDVTSRTCDDEPPFYRRVLSRSCYLSRGLSY